MELFSRKKRWNLSSFKELALPILFFILLLIGLLWGSSNVFFSVEKEQLHATEQAVRRATVQCYALEGHYPQSVDYLTENYGLIINRKKYIVHYQTIGSNLMPEISVFPIAPIRGGKKNES